MRGNLTLDLKLDRFLHKPHRIQILQLDLIIETRLPNLPHGDVRLAAEVSLLHVRVAGSDPLKHAADVVDVVVCLP